MAATSITNEKINKSYGNYNSTINWPTESFYNTIILFSKLLKNASNHKLPFVLHCFTRDSQESFWDATGFGSSRHYCIKGNESLLRKIYSLILDSFYFGSLVKNLWLKITNQIKFMLAEILLLIPSYMLWMSNII